jgi:UDP-GlcNAc3NAcA epimerase
VKIVTIIGARPQFIKAAVVSRSIVQRNDIQEIIVHTGQHFDPEMSEVFFKELMIREPDYFLDINNMTHGAMVGTMMIEIEKILLKECPDIVLVYGDTNSTLAGALTAAKMNIKVAHVEAGLRSFNRKMPEEINRMVTDKISSLLFCPNENAVQNLKNEGINSTNATIAISGDVMYDSLLYYQKICKRPNIAIPDHFVLCTLHREENTNNPENLLAILSALEQISLKTSVLFPIHPRTQAVLEQLQYDFAKTLIHFITPVGYLDMLWLLSHSKMVITDSGGLQKEAYFSQKYCITLRNETEWTELVESGCNFLIGCHKENLITKYNELIYKEFNISSSLFYGDGHAGNKIVELL